MVRTLANSTLEMIIKKDMGYTRLEFLNQFKCFAEHFAKTLNYTLDNDTITLHLDDKSNTDSDLTIRFYEQAARSLGSLKIPRLSVQFTFNNYTELQQKQFFEKFDMSFQRGGG